MLCGITKLLKWMLKSCAIGSLCMLYAFIQDLASREMSEKKQGVGEMGNDMQQKSLPRPLKARMLQFLDFKRPGAAWRMSLKPEECTDIIV